MLSRIQPHQQTHLIISPEALGGGKRCTRLFGSHPRAGPLGRSAGACHPRPAGALCPLLGPSSPAAVLARRICASSRSRCPLLSFLQGEHSTSRKQFGKLLETGRLAMSWQECPRSSPGPAGAATALARCICVSSLCLSSSP